MSEREAKPPWPAVPLAVRARAEKLLGARVTRARRTYGGYGPSATFLLTLDDGRRAFFKGTYPLAEGSGVKWILVEEERVYERIPQLIRPWAPAYYGSFRVQGWHVLLMEALGSATMPPWTRAKARRAAHSYAEFHASTVGRSLPRWIPRNTHHDFARFWGEGAAENGALDRLAGLAPDNREQARAWLDENLDALAQAERGLLRRIRRGALLHCDTRSDNIRLQGSLLRLFDWPFAFVGPPEFDLFAFAQSIESEGGPAGEEVMGWYGEVLSVDPAMLVASAAGLAGYFADRAPRPALEGLPRLRTVQRQQLKASLRLAARLLELPPPDWLEQVPG